MMTYFLHYVIGNEELQGLRQTRNIFTIISQS